MNAQTKPVLLSGIQPTGSLTIGNYIGAIRNWIALEDRYDCLFVLVDLHAITVRNDPTELLRRSYEFLALYLACGLDPEQNTIFVQSHVPQHTQLGWVLSCFTQFGRLGRMTQFKEKSTQHPDNVNAGLFTYPVLMAADILLYGTDLVPVGEDQTQHLELARDVAQRFNCLHGAAFTVPEPYIPEIGARIMSLQDPAAKMDKSDRNPANYIALLDEPDAIRKKIARAVTDAGSDVVLDASKPGISNLLTIYSTVAGDSLESLAHRYRGKGYAQFKRDLAEVLIEFLRPIQARYREVRDDTEGMRKMLRLGADKARSRAEQTMAKVHRLLGFIPQ